MSKIKSWKAYLGFGVAVAAIAGAFFAGYWLFALSAIGMGYGVFVILLNKSAKKQAELKCLSDTRATVHVLKDLFMEYKNYLAECKEYDDLYERIINEFNNI